LSESDLSQTLASLQTLEDRHALSSFVIGQDLSSEILKSVLAGHLQQWRRMYSRLQELLDESQTLRNNLSNSRVRIPEKEIDKLLFDSERRLNHFEAGGRHGWWPFIPRVVRKMVSSPKW